MKSRIAFLLGSFSLALAACATSPTEGQEDEALEQDEPALALDTAGEPGGPSTSTEYVYFRCSTNGGLYLTRPACLTACPTGTCRLTLICKNSQGEQIPCP